MGGCDVLPDKYAPVMKVNGKYTGWRLNMTKMVLRNTQDKSEVLVSEPFHETVLDTGAGGQAGNEINDIDLIFIKMESICKYCSLSEI